MGRTLRRCFLSDNRSHRGRPSGVDFATEVRELFLGWPALACILSKMTLVKKMVPWRRVGIEDVFTLLAIADVVHPKTASARVGSNEILSRSGHIV